MNLPLLPDPCPVCASTPHDEDCPVPEHEAAAAGDPEAQAAHDPEECHLCLWDQPIACTCRCGKCCERLLIEATTFDASREPKISERGKPIFTPAELTASGVRELEGYILNRQEGGCMFFSRDAHGQGICEIYETRPVGCRHFDCDDPDSHPLHPRREAFNSLIDEWLSIRRNQPNHESSEETTHDRPARSAR